MNKKLIAKKIFSINDQKIFLKLSRDYNPAHSLKKTKNQFNSTKIIVHGINILLTALELFLKFRKMKPKLMRCFFYRPIYLNEQISFFAYYENKKNSEQIIEVQNSKKNVCTRFVFLEKTFHKKIKNSKKKISLIKTTRSVANSNPIKFLNKSFQINFPNLKILKRFKLISKNFSSNLFNALLITSYFIGMKCPGKRAIFIGIDLNLNDLNNFKKYLVFNVNNFDKKLSMFTINTSGFIHLNIKSIYKKIF